ncbi:MAG: sigma-54-dependent Fis family transcriptional regulator, partial [Proteobacteria bacterium]
LSDLGFESAEADTAEAGIRLLKQETFNAIFIDFNLGKEDGLDGIKRIKAAVPSAPPIVMLTAYTTSENTIAAMKLGAAEHLTKPLGVQDLKKILARVAPEAAGPSAKPKASASAIIAEGPAMREVLKLVGRAAASDSPVLLTGETGSGKEVVARAIHANSDRAKAPFEAINCAAIPPDLLESELFGHEKGAFTGAERARLGVFQRAEGGTVFLDEIGDMNLALQAKILRVLQEKELTPVGGSRAVKINVRYLAATHQNLAELIREGRFRADLFYRLNVLDISLPPLRDRPEDLKFLTAAILAGLGKESLRLSLSAEEKLKAHAWPGNVRELKNVLERASIVATADLIRAEDLRILHLSAAEEESTSGAEEDLPLAVAQLEKKLIERALRATNGNRTEAARRLKIQRQLLYTKMKDYLIEIPKGAAE